MRQRKFWAELQGEKLAQIRKNFSEYLIYALTLKNNILYNKKIIGVDKEQSSVAEGYLQCLKYKTFHCPSLYCTMRYINQYSK